MNFSRSEIESEAIQRWGQPNKGLSSRSELRFGKRGSVSVKLDTNQFYDHESAEGGAVISERQLAPEIQMPRMCVKKYNYLDEAGRIHMQVRRFMPKDFRQCRPDPNEPGKWIHSVKGLPQIPYRLPELMQSDYVIIVEGEKDADELTRFGLTATCNPQGSNKWPDELNEYFRGKDVYIIPDNDEAGIAHARLVSSKLFSVAQSVRVSDVCSGLKKRADMWDWLQVNPVDGLMAELQGFKVVSAPVIVEPVSVNTSDVFPTLDADDITAVTTADDFVEGLLSKAQMSVVYGPSNCGKTFFMSDLCLHIALGKSWRGRNIDAGGVIYVAAEGAYGIRNRVAAFKQHYDIKDGIPFSVIPASVNMLDAQVDVNKLINTIRLKARDMGHVAIIVLDTLARVMAGGNENTAEDMGSLVINADKIRHATGAHVCFIHHSGKDESKGARGSSALRAATDTEIEIRKTGDISVATVTKQREMEINGSFVFGLTVVEIGVNDRGKAVTSCVVSEIDSSVVKQQKKRLPRGANQKILLKAMINCGADSLLKDNQIGLPPTCKGMDLDEFYALSSGKLSVDIKHRRSRFNDAIASLVSEEYMGLENGFLWLVP